MKKSVAGLEEGGQRGRRTLREDQLKSEMEKRGAENGIPVGEGWGEKKREGSFGFSGC